eukprot:214562-Chlamydomonas_euryale.AAC.11
MALDGACEDPADAPAPLNQRPVRKLPPQHSQGTRRCVRRPPAPSVARVVGPLQHPHGLTHSRACHTPAPTVACIVAPRQLRAAAQHAHKAGRAAAVAHVCAHAARVAAAIRGSHEEGVRGAHKARMRARKRALPRRRAHAAAQPWPHARRKLKRAPLDVLRAVAERLLYGDAHGGTVDGLHNTVEPVAAAVVELQPNDAEVLPDGEALGPCCGVH